LRGVCYGERQVLGKRSRHRFWLERSNLPPSRRMERAISARRRSPVMPRPSVSR